MTTAFVCVPFPSRKRAHPPRTSLLSHTNHGVHWGAKPLHIPKISVDEAHAGLRRPEASIRPWGGLPSSRSCRSSRDLPPTNHTSLRQNRFKKSTKFSQRNCRAPAGLPRAMTPEHFSARRVVRRAVWVGAYTEKERERGLQWSHMLKALKVLVATTTTTRGSVDDEHDGRGGAVAPGAPTSPGPAAGVCAWLCTVARLSWSRPRTRPRLCECA